jgi:hypothetical protein
MKRLFERLKLALVIGAITVPVFVMAQPGGTGGGNPGDPVEDVPFDGGVTLLVAAGVAYGLKKVHEKKKAERDIKL